MAIVIAKAISWTFACTDRMVMWAMDGITKQRKRLRRSRNWPQVGHTGPKESLALTLAFRFWSFYALLWCIMSDLWFCRGRSRIGLFRIVERGECSSPSRKGKGKVLFWAECVCLKPLLFHIWLNCLSCCCVARHQSYADKTRLL